MKRKIFAIILSVFLILPVFSGCNNKDTSGSNKKLSVVCTIFPQYDWVKQILGDKASGVDMTLLLDNGIDLHNYQPTADDIIKISECDLFIYVGGESDKWVDDVLKSAKNKNIQVINLMDVLKNSVKEEEVKEGMEAEEEEDSKEEEPEYDEHVWLSLKNAKTICGAISDSLGKIDKSNADTYKQNSNSYIEKLNNLDTEYQNTVDGAKRKTVLFGDRFPFRYLVDDYKLDYYAAFVGCSAETEASFKTIVFLANKIDELSLPAILTIEGSDKSIANSIISNTKNKNQKILVINSIQSVTSEDVQNGMTYLSIMKDNLGVLKEALD